MRKLLLFTTMSLCLVLLACQSNAQITLETMNNAQSYLEISKSQLENKLEAGDDFMLIISSASCSSCADFLPILNDVIQTYDIVIYKIEEDEDFDRDNGLVAYEYTPTIVIIKDGEVVKSIDAFKNEAYFSSYDGFMGFYSKYVLSPLA